MITLGLDTTGPWCTAALVDEARVLAEASEKIGRGHAEALAPMVQSVLKSAQLTAQDLDRIAVCTGPGSFTGLRVALSFAKGLALPRRIPTLGLSLLEVLARQADPDGSKKIVAISNVKRGELCWAVYEHGREIRPPQTQLVDAVQNAVSETKADAIVGDGATLIGHPSEIVNLSGPVLAWMSQGFTPQERPANPLYSRAPDAKLPGGIDPRAVSIT